MNTNKIKTNSIAEISLVFVRVMVLGLKILLFNGLFDYINNIEFFRDFGIIQVVITGGICYILNKHYVREVIATH